MTGLESLILNVLPSLIASGLISTFYQLRNLWPLSSDENEKLRKTLTSSAFKKSFKKVIPAVTEASKKIDQKLAKKIEKFLGSPEAEAIVRQIFATNLTKKIKSQDSIRKEFIATLSISLKKPKPQIAAIGNYLFDGLLHGCEKALAISIEKGVLASHEAMSAVRHKSLLNEIEAIQKNLDLLSSQKPKIEEFLKFEGSYRKQIGARHEKIKPPHFDINKKFPIEDLYVSPKFQQSPSFIKTQGQRNIFRDGKEFGVDNFLPIIFRTVLLGQPGGGKSTFTDFLCSNLSKKYAKKLTSGRLLTPIHVVLRDYGAQKKNRNISILQFIEETANSKYQVKSPARAFEYLFLNGRALVIFDGLDELLDTNYREQISGDVESFCNLYPSVPVLVTSREVGYDQAPLDEKRFEVFRLSPFGVDQVKDYVSKWFCLDDDLSVAEKEKKTKAFLKESQIVSDLCSNPLMLALMCNIYRGESYIPKNRPEVYEKCAVMLFERWDKSRGISVPLSFESHIRQAMEFLACWIFTNQELQQGVTEDGLVQQTTEYLLSWRYENQDEAKNAAREFVEFCRGRAWVFTDTGTTPDGESLYQFTHQTFLEYFAAAHLVRTLRTPKNLGKELLPKIAKQEWDVVAQLACQIQNKNIEGAADELLNQLLKKSKNYKSYEIIGNYLSFAARCLSFLVPKPQVVRDITNSCIKSCILWGKDRNPQGKIIVKRGFEKGFAMDVLPYLLESSTENRSVIADCLEKILVENIKSGNDIESQLAIEIGLRVDEIFDEVGILKLQTKKEEPWKFWKNFRINFSESYAKEIRGLSKKNLLVGKTSLYRGDVSIDSGDVRINELIKWHGMGSIFMETAYLLFPNISLISLVEFSFSVLCELLITGNSNRKYLLRVLNELGKNLIVSPNLFSSNKIGNLLIPRQYRFIGNNLPKEEVSKRSMITFIELEDNIKFGAFSYIAMALELEFRRTKDFGSLQIKEMVNPFQDWFEEIFEARFEPLKKDKVNKSISKFNFNKKQENLICQWANNEFDFLTE